jgi:chromosome segregation protein
MRFEQLRLERFGHFADTSLDFRGDRIQLIYGPNASGKSTIRAAISELLFGIGDRTTYDFRFEKNQLRLGAVVASQDGRRRLDFVRYKRRMRTLRTREGAELDEDALAPFLSGIDQRTYLDLYVLDQEGLRVGGEQMLSAEGDLGRSLFAASSGFADLAEVQSALSDELTEIAVVGRKMKTSRLWQVEAAYNEARARQKAAALRKSEWDAAKNALADAESRIAALGEERRRIERERSIANRKMGSLLVLPRLDRDRAEAEALASVPDMPEGFGERWRKAEGELQRAVDAESGAAAELERVKRERAGLPADAGPLPEHAALIEDLHQRVANIADQQQAVMRLTRDVWQCNDRLRNLIGELGVASPPDIERLLVAIPARSVCTRVEELIGERGRIDAAIEAAQQRRDRAQRAVDRGRAAFERLGKRHDPGDAEREYETSIGFGNVSRELADAIRRLGDTTAVQAAAIARLVPWKGSAEELERMPFPLIDTVASVGAKVTQQADEERRNEDALAEVNRALRAIEDDLRLLAAADEIPTTEAIAAARQARDISWGRIRESGLAGKGLAETDAAAHGELVQRADNLVDRHVQHRELPTLLRNRARALAAVEECAESLQRTQARKGEEWSRWRGLWADTGWDPQAVGDVEAMKAWLDRVKETKLAATAVRTAAEVLAEAKVNERLAREAISRAAELIGFALEPTLEIDELRRKTATAITVAREAWEEARHVGKSFGEQAAELEQAEAEVNEHVGELEAWRIQWADSMPVILQETAADPVGVREILSAWGAIREEHAKRAAAQHRLDGVKEGLSGHEAAVRSTISALDGNYVAVLGLGDDWSQWPPRLYDALKVARQAADRIDAADKAVAGAERTHAAASRTLERAKNACGQLRAEAALPASVVDVTALVGPAERKREVATRLTETERELAQASEGMPEAELRAAIADANVDSMRAEIAALTDSAVVLDEPVRQASADRLRAEQSLRDLGARTGFLTAALDADAAAAEAKDLARRWMSLRAAQIVLARSVERYRKANEGPLLRRADEIFGTIVRNRLPDDFIGLEVDYDDPRKPTIIARRRDGTSCPVTKMSTGTRDQLWLALRIAALERRALDVEPMPFLGDDLFDSSDEFRSEAMLAAVGELARHTQVLLFTHHAHIVETAERALGSRVEVQRLEAATAEAA